MRLLSLDVGLTTGYCVQSEFKVLSLGNIVWDGNAQALRALLKHVLEDTMPDRCLIERPVIMRGELGDSLQAVLNAITGMRLPPCEYCQPSEWKPAFGKVKVPTAGVTVHERDAYRMGRWWLQTRQGSY